MKDPVRWKDGGGPDGVKELLRLAARPAPMTAAQRAQTAANVAKLVRGGAGGGGGAGSAGGAAGWVKGLAIGAGLGVAAVALRVLIPAASAPELPAASAPAVVPGDVAGSAEPASKGADPSSETAGSPVSAGGASAASGAPAADGAPGDGKPAEGSRRPSAPRPTATAAASPSSAAGDALLEEARSLEGTRARVAADPAGALQSLSAHRARFPRAQLVAERDYLTIDALRRLGRHDEARALARAFLARYPSSPYSAEVERSAQDEKPPGGVTNP